jgi:hypothetical protein
LFFTSSAIIFRIKSEAEEDSVFDIFKAPIISFYF